MKFTCATTIAICVLMAGTLFGQDASPDARMADVGQPAPNALERVEQLEAETRALQAEIDARQRQNAEQAAEVAQRIAVAQDAAPQPAAGVPAYVTMDQASAEIKKFSWTKGEFKVTPYGILWGSTVYETQRTTPGEFPIYVLSPDTVDNDGYYVDGRSTRFGVDVAGPAIPWCADAKLGGRVEFDFQRQFDTPNRAGVLFRQAFVELKNDEYRLLIGQAWEVISPLYAGSIMYIPGSGAGNLGYRRAQLRGERYVTFSDVSLLTIQSSLNSNIISDFTSDPLVFGRESGWPVLEGRVALTMGERTGPDALPVTLGVSGHVGEQDFDFTGVPNPGFGVGIPTWSFNADLRYPITKRFGFQGELFTGSNLGAFMGGILQGVDRGHRAGIRSSGGWGDLWFDWRPDLHSHVGYSIDDPVNRDLTSPSGRVYNDFWFTNIIYDITKAFNVGFEVSYWKTHFVALEPGDSLRFEMAARYSF